MPLHYILLTGLYCFLIFENSAVSDPLPIDVRLPFSDKAAHAVMFGGLCAVVAMGVSRRPQTLPPWLLAAIPVAFATAYGMTDELHQLYVPGRSCDWADLLADFLGATGVQTMLMLHWKRSGSQALPLQT